MESYAIDPQRFSLFCHDARSSMAVVSSFLELLALRPGVQTDEKAAHFADRCTKQMQALHLLLDDFDQTTRGRQP